MASRWTALVFLAVFGVYQAICFVDIWRDTTHRPRIFPLNLTWPAQWRMFTLKDVTNTRLDFEARVDGEWVRLPMERWLPTRWDSGYRWERSARDRGTLDAFLAYACERSGAEEARVVEVRWRRAPGEPLQVEADRSASVRAGRECSRRPPTVRGTVW